MEDQFKHTEHKKLPGMTEVFRVYYDRNRISFDEFLYLEHLAILTAAKAQWKIFQAVPVHEIGPLMVCKN
jgi:hypothetical protein